MRPRTGTANPSPSTKNSATGPAWRSSYAAARPARRGRGTSPAWPWTGTVRCVTVFDQFPQPADRHRARPPWPGSPASSACPPWSKPGGRSPASPCRSRSATTSPATPTTISPEARHDRPRRRRRPVRRRHPGPRPRPGPARRGRGRPGRPRHRAAPGPVPGPGLAGQPDRGHRRPWPGPSTTTGASRPPTRRRTRSPARSASPCATRTPSCPPAPSGSPKWSPPRSPARPARPSSQAPRRQPPLLPAAAAQIPAGSPGRVLRTSRYPALSWCSVSVRIMQPPRKPPSGASGPTELKPSQSHFGSENAGRGLSEETRAKEGLGASPVQLGRGAGKARRDGLGACGR